MLVVAVSGWEIAGSAVVLFILLLLLAKAVRPEGRVAERMTVRGDYIGDPPGFRKPPDESGLL